MNLEKLGEDCTRLIKEASFFPFKSGNLKFNATKGQMQDSKTYRINFDSTIAPYIEALEEGSKPHDIPNAFGRGINFGIGGRFDGKFHSGSTKHKGFISNKCVNAIINYICETYNGVQR